MRTSRAYRFSHILILLTTLALLWPTSVAAARPIPNSMAAAGDSITRAFNTCWFPFIDCVNNSWSTGTSSAVTSHYTRILSQNAAIKGKNYNDAKSGAKMADLPGQMTTISGRTVQYVTVQMGGNDICTSSVDTMTTVESFETSFRSAMRTISATTSVATFYVTSIPDAYRLWEIFKDNSSARSTWNTFGVCQSLLANPLSTADADVQRRARVHDRSVALNDVLKRVCSEYVNCVWDNWAIFCTRFATSDITTRDYFHPSVAGQKKFSQVTWDAGPFVAAPVLATCDTRYWLTT